MPDRDEAIAEREASNFAEFVEHGPGLRGSTRSWVIARDRTTGKVLLGGLGGMGVGQMWVDDSDDLRQDETYDDAPEGRSS